MGFVSCSRIFDSCLGSHPLATTSLSEQRRDLSCWYRISARSGRSRQPSGEPPCCRDSIWHLAWKPSYERPAREAHVARRPDPATHSLGNCRVVCTSKGASVAAGLPRPASGPWHVGPAPSSCGIGLPRLAALQPLVPSSVLAHHRPGPPEWTATVARIA
jgi:hypothetical protein